MSTAPDLSSTRFAALCTCTGPANCDRASGGRKRGSGAAFLPPKGTRRIIDPRVLNGFAAVSVSGSRAKRY